MERKYSRLPLGLCRRSKIKNKASGCNSIEGLLELKKAEDCNDRLKTVDFNFDEMSTQTILAFMKIKSHIVREKVFAIIKKAIITDTNPLTHRPLGFHSVTKPMLEDIIELVSTGKITPKPNPKVSLTQREIELLDFMRIHALNACKADNEKDNIVSLIKKIRGIRET
jgi:hypothetical protein